MLVNGKPVSFASSELRAMVAKFDVAMWVRGQGGEMTKEEMDYVTSRLDLSPAVRNLPEQKRIEVITSWLEEFRGKKNGWFETGPVMKHQPPQPQPPKIAQITTRALVPTRTPSVSKEYKSTRPRLHVPKDKSVIAEVKEAMQAFPKDSAMASKSISMGGDNYRAIRRMILIEARPNLPQEDRDKIKACFEVIEKERQIASVRKVIDALTAKHWLKKKDPQYVLNHRRRRFDQNITAICESCESTVNMNLPDEFSKDDVLKTIGELSRSIELIGRLMRKLVGNEEEK